MDGIRKLSRLGNEVHLSASIAVLDLTGRRHDLGVVALLVLSRCAADWVCEGEIRPPARPTRTISLRAVANSLREPHATVQRHAGKLLATGLLVDTGHGYAIGTAPPHAAAIVRLLGQAHDTLIRLIADLSPDLAFARPPSPPDPNLFAATVAAALDIWLIPFEATRDPVTDWISKLVLLVIAIANVRHITVDATLSARYADLPTPDALRRPIDVRAIGTLTGLSYGTVYRHCQKLAAADVIRYERGGWLVAASQITDLPIDSGVRALLGYYAKRINELVAIGLDTTQVEARYLAGRPDYVALPF